MFSIMSLDFTIREAWRQSQIKVLIAHKIDSECRILSCMGNSLKELFSVMQIYGDCDEFCQPMLVTGEDVIYIFSKTSIR